MLKIGITGGIGSGKSLICKIFNVMGIPVYNADLAAKKIMHENDHAKEAIISLFGEEAYVKNQLNRKHLATSAFSNPKLLTALEEIVHPLVYEDLTNWFDNQTAVYALYESAIMLQTDFYRELDLIIYVYADVDIRIQRTLERDQSTIESIQKRIQQQIDPVVAASMADYVIINQNILLIPQVLNIHKDLISNP